MALWRASSQTAVVGEREAEEEKRRVEASTQTEEVEVQPCSEIFLAELQREFAQGCSSLRATVTVEQQWSRLHSVGMLWLASIRSPLTQVLT